ncbi:hypothetical protein KM043_016363 [Ampulex compressa]|nr:hypothetical protein KM043_016363 [Ampulex compressa]
MEKEKIVFIPDARGGVLSPGRMKGERWRRQEGKTVRDFIIGSQRDETFFLAIKDKGGEDSKAIKRRDKRRMGRDKGITRSGENKTLYLA